MTIIAIEHGPFIVDLPIENGGSFHSCFFKPEGIPPKHSIVVKLSSGPEAELSSYGMTGIRIRPYSRVSYFWAKELRIEFPNHVIAW